MTSLKRAVPVSSDVFENGVSPFLTAQDIANMRLVSTAHSRTYPDSYWLKRFKTDYPNNKLLGDGKMTIPERVFWTEKILKLKGTSTRQKFLHDLIRKGQRKEFRLFYDPVEDSFYSDDLKQEAVFSNELEIYKHLRSFDDKKVIESESTLMMRYAIYSLGTDVLKYIVENEKPNLSHIDQYIAEARMNEFDDVVEYLESL